MKNVIVTGASSGFGLLMTQNFINEGWSVHATSRAGTIDLASHPNLHVYPLDLSNRESITAFSKAVQASAPTIDVLINNAGFGLFGAFEDLDEDQMRREMEVNFLGPALLTQNLLPSLRKARGHVINFSSVLGFSAMPLTSLYCASKFALEGWSEALRYELAPHHVHVTVIQPGSHRTKFGQKTEWGSRSSDQNSAYAGQTKNFQTLLARMATQPGSAKPEDLAEKVCSIAGTSNPPTILRFGKDAAAVVILRSALPLGAVFKVSEKVFGRVFNHSRT